MYSKYRTGKSPFCLTGDLRLWQTSEFYRAARVSGGKGGPHSTEKNHQQGGPPASHQPPAPCGGGQQQVGQQRLRKPFGGF